MNCLVYLRVSTREQAEEGYSIPAKKEACNKYVKEKEIPSLSKGNYLLWRMRLKDVQPNCQEKISLLLLSWPKKKQ